MATSVTSLYIIPFTSGLVALWRSKFVRVGLKPTLPGPISNEAYYRTRFDIIGGGVVPVSAMTIAGSYAVQHMIDMSHFALKTPIDRIVFTLRFHTPSVFFMFLLLARIFDHRFNCHQAINHQQCPHLDFEYSRRHLQNTVEQFLYTITSHLILATYLEPKQMAIIPFFCCMWLAGRIFFVAEYDGMGETSGSRGRIWGFLMTFIPTTLALFTSVIAFVSYLHDPMGKVLIVI